MPLGVDEATAVVFHHMPDVQSGDPTIRRELDGGAIERKDEIARANVADGRGASAGGEHRREYALQENSGSHRRYCCSVKPTAQPNQLSAFAVTAPGLEAICAGELAALGIQATAEEGGVAWSG